MAQQTPVTQAGVFTNLASELPVVPKSTTSRVVLDNDLIRVVEFTFDAGELLTEHASPRAVVVQLLLPRGALSSPSLCRFIPALSKRPYASHRLT